MYLRKQIAQEYDIIVAGAGPAGSTAAWQAAREGMRVLLLEKDREVGSPVRCAEGVAKKELEDVLERPADPRWIAAEIRKFRLFAPNGKSVYVNIDEVGYVLHRRLFDADLALQAVKAGARLITGAQVTGVLAADGRIQGARVEIEGESLEIRSRLLIAADGVESRVARWAGIDSTLPVKDVETCAQYTLSGIPIDSDTCDFYFSRDFAPGGYAWVFPKGEGTANVGLGVAGNFARKITPEKYLDIYLDRHFPRASAVSKTVGGVPVSRTLKELTADGFMVVGDAARQVNPISGGGILSGMIAGKMAGRIGAGALKNGQADKKSLRPYVRQWHKRIGKQHQRYYRLKEALMKFEDEQFNYIADEYLKLEQDKRTLMNLFKLAFKSNPKFLLDVLKIFSSL